MKKNIEPKLVVKSVTKQESKRGIYVTITPQNSNQKIQLSNNIVSNYGIKELSIISDSISKNETNYYKLLWCYDLPKSSNSKRIILQANTNKKDDKSIIISKTAKKTSIVPKSSDYKLAINFMKTFSEEDFANFMQELQNFPFFALKNPVGKRIYNALKEYLKKNTLIINKGTKFYRCREWDKKQVSHFTPDSMWNPPARKPSQHRFNTVGVSYLYVGNSPLIARKESGLTANKKRFTTVEMILKENVKVLDLSSDNTIIFNKCSIPNAKKEYDTYLFPNFIASCLDYMRINESIDIDGIKYLSTKNKDGENFYNIVFFDKGKSSFEKVKIIPN